jgi:hypothetical protein
MNVFSKAYPTIAVVGEETASGGLDVQTALNESPITLDLSAPRKDIVQQHTDAKRAGAVDGFQWTDIEDARVCVFVDPLDGTTEFTHGRYFAVTTLVGIAVDGKPAGGVVVSAFGGRSVWGYVGFGVVGLKQDTRSLPGSWGSNRGMYALSGLEVQMGPDVGTRLENCLVEIKRISANKDVVLQRVSAAGWSMIELLDRAADAFIVPGAMGCRYVNGSTCTPHHEDVSIHPALVRQEICSLTSYLPVPMLCRLTHIYRYQCFTRT